MMAKTLNARAQNYAYQFLFMEPPNEGYPPNASVPLPKLAWEFCWYDDCDRSVADGVACRKHAQAMVLGVAKMIASGTVLAEMSSRGVMYARLSPRGVLDVLGWATLPPWSEDRVDLIEWARVQAAERV